MKAILLVVATATALLAGDVAHAADTSRRPVTMSAPVSPLQNPQAQAVAGSRECWRACERQCAAELLACGYRAPGAECLPATDACDRSCQQQCRSTGDPLLDLFN